MPDSSQSRHHLLPVPRRMRWYRAAFAAGLWWFVPLGLLFSSATMLALRSSAPERLVLERTWGPIASDSPFGRAEGGIDIAAFVGHACLRVLILAIAVSGVACLIGVPLGAMAAMRRGRLEPLLLRVCDLVQSFPTFLLALAVLSTVTMPSRLHLGIVFMVTAWAPFARVAHAQARWVADSEFVVAAQAIGATFRQIVLRHVIPHLTGPVTVQLGSCAAGLVLSESALGFVGLGPSDGVSLGALLEQGTVAMLLDARVLVIAALTIVATSGALQLASEGMRRRLVPA